MPKPPRFGGMANKPYANRDGLLTGTTSRRSAFERMQWRSRKGLSSVQGTLCVSWLLIPNMSIKLVVVTIITSVLAVAVLEMRGREPILNIVTGICLIVLVLWWAFFLNLQDKAEADKVRKQLYSAARGVSALAALMLRMVVIPVLGMSAALTVVYTLWIIIKSFIKLFS